MLDLTIPLLKIKCYEMNSSCKILLLFLKGKKSIYFKKHLQVNIS